MSHHLSLSLGAASALLIAAAPAAAAPQWSAPSTLASIFKAPPASSDLRDSFTVKDDAAGNQTAVWIGGNAGAPRGIYATYRPLGKGWTAPTLVEATNPATPENLTLDVSADGHAVVAWSSRETPTVEGDPAPTPSTRLATRTPAGAWSAAEVLEPAPDHLNLLGTTDYATSIAPGGEVWASWARADDLEGYGEPVVHLVHRAAGATAWTEQTPFSTERPAVPAFDDAAGAVAAYRTPGNGIAATTRPAGGTWSTPVTLAPDDSGQGAYDLHLAVDGAGDATAVWMRTVDGSFRIQSSRRPRGGSWSTTTEVASSPVPNSTFSFGALLLGIDRTGRATVTWQAATDVTVGIFAATSDASGAWSAPVRVAPTIPTRSPLEMEVGRDGQGMLTWTSDDGATVAERPAGGAWAAPSLLPEAGGSVALASTIDPNGVASAFWAAGTEIRTASAPLGGAVVKTPKPIVKVSARVQTVFGAPCPASVTVSAPSTRVVVPTTKVAGQCFVVGSVPLPSGTKIGSQTVVLITGNRTFPVILTPRVVDAAA